MVVPTTGGEGVQSGQDAFVPSVAAFVEQNELRRQACKPILECASRAGRVNQCSARLLNIVGKPGHAIPSGRGQPGRGRRRPPFSSMLALAPH